VKPDSSLRVSGPHVVAEEIDGEVIAINLDTGAYFSFRGTAAEIWRELLAGEVRVLGMVAMFGDRYAAEPAEIEHGVAAFCVQLEAEGLIAAVEAELNNADPAPLKAAGPAPATPGADAAFATPVYEKYTDMEEFLLVDPIHEVDVSEWPAARPRQSP
jgi:hypothetical protein